MGFIRSLIARKSAESASSRLLLKEMAEGQQEFIKAPFTLWERNLGLRREGIGKVAHRAWNVPDKRDQQPFNSIDRHRLRLKWKPIVVQESFHDRIGSRKNAV